MIMELISYLIRNMAGLEVEGIKSRTEGVVGQFFDRLNKEKESMVRPVMEEFFQRMERQREILVRQIARVAVFGAGVFAFVIGLSTILDRLLAYEGAGFVLVGALALLLSLAMKDKERSRG